jgi:light-harvesting complex 1 beta chain
MADDRGSASGLSEPEAREFHRIFMTSFIVFVVVAIVAHFLAWAWRPWLPGVDGYTMLDSGVQVALSHLSSFVA